MITNILRVYHNNNAHYSTEKVIQRIGNDYLFHKKIQI